MADDGMTDAHKAAAANVRAEDERKARAGAEMVAWVREQIAEDRRLAEAANSGPWSVDNETFAESIYSADDTCVIGGGRWGGEASVFDSNADALHIVRHDPRTVLAQCESHTAILDEHQHVEVIPSQMEAFGCRVCSTGYDAQPQGFGWCRTVRAVALAYQHRPGFREEWRR